MACLSYPPSGKWWQSLHLHQKQLKGLMRIPPTGKSHYNEKFKKWQWVSNKRQNPWGASTHFQNRSKPTCLQRRSEGHLHSRVLFGFLWPGLSWSREHQAQAQGMSGLIRPNISLVCSRYSSDGSSPQVPQWHAYSSPLGVMPESCCVAVSVQHCHHHNQIIK